MNSCSPNGFPVVSAPLQFPFNSELETMTPVLIEEGVKLSHSLQAKFNKPLSSTLSQARLSPLSPMLWICF